MARRSFHRRVLMYKCLNGLVNLNYDFRKNAEHGYNTRGSENIRVPKVKTNWGKQRFIVQAVKDWNSVPEHVKQAKTLTSFKNFLTQNFLDFNMCMNSKYLWEYFSARIFIYILTFFNVALSLNFLLMYYT